MNIQYDQIEGLGLDRIERKAAPPSAVIARKARFSSDHCAHGYRRMSAMVIDTRNMWCLFFLP